MPKLNYVGPRVEISNHGIYYKQSKEDKYVYLVSALYILNNLVNNNQIVSIDNVENNTLDEVRLFKTLSDYENNIEVSIAEESKKYIEKIEHKIEYIQTLPQLTDVDKEVWIKNIELMKEYKINRAINKMYYMHTIENIVQVIKAKKIKEINVPFNKHFFHVLNTIKGVLITGKPSLNANVTHKDNIEGNMTLKLTIK